jgi:hypothetical protein
MIIIDSIIVMYLFCAACLSLENCQNEKRARYMTLRRDLNKEEFHTMYWRRYSMTLLSAQYLSECYRHI